MGDRWTSKLPPLLSDIPEYLRRSPAVVLPRKKRYRRRGKRGGALVRFKAYLASTCVTCPDGCYVPAVAGRLLRRRDRWLRPVFPDSQIISEAHLLMVPSSPRWARIHRGEGVDFLNLRPLDRVASAATASEDQTLRLALFNVRSLANKTFLLNDFFTSRELDLMFLMETWLHDGDLTSFSELLPPRCGFLSSPRVTGRGGGLASVFKCTFQCRKILFDSCSSFELQLFELNCPVIVLCAVVYRPPKFNKDFIQDFADFVAGIALKYDRFLIVGDFNIHVCCESRPMSKDFINLIDSFNLI